MYNSHLGVGNAVKLTPLYRDILKYEEFVTIQTQKYS
jgi:hypothetical protein